LLQPSIDSRKQGFGQFSVLRRKSSGLAAFMLHSIFRSTANAFAAVPKRMNSTLSISHVDGIVIRNMISTNRNEMLLCPWSPVKIINFFRTLTSLKSIFLDVSSVTEEAILLIKRTFQPSLIRMKRKHGYLARKASRNGIKVLNRRITKGRTRLTV